MTSSRKGTLQHLCLEGKNLIQSVPNGDFFIGVQARAELAAFANLEVPYALAVTLEMAQPVRLDLFADVAARVRLKRIETPVRPRTRVKA